MRRLLWLLPALAALLPVRPVDGMELIVVRPDGAGFMERESRRAWVPFGTNYYDPNTGWAPKLWRQFDEGRVRTHFDVMQSLGVNCARVFLTAAGFQPTEDKVEEAALGKLDAMVRIAREHGIRLIPTGPDHWEGSPDYWRGDRFGGERALKALEVFWETVAGRYRGEPAIFAWDLLNEPHIPWSNPDWPDRWRGRLREKYGSWEALRTDWGSEVPADGQWEAISIPADEADADSVRLADYQGFREYLADEWVRRQAEAISRVDPTHLVTVGYIQWSYPLVRRAGRSRYAAFDPLRQARWVDFHTIHFYPVLGSPFASEETHRKNLDYLRAVLAWCHVGKPVVLGEFGWYGGGAPQNHPFLSEQQQADWIAAEIEATRGLADGWLSWPFADTPSSRDISLYSGLVKPDMTLKAWGRTFQSYSADAPGLPLVKPSLPQRPEEGVLTAAEAELNRVHARYADAVVRALADR